MNPLKYVVILAGLVILMDSIVKKKLYTYPLKRVPQMRNDTQGQGSFGAIRSGHKHQGIDLVCSPGEAVFSPVDGVVTRKFFVYSGDTNFMGCEIQGDDGEAFKLMYVSPIASLIGKRVKAGQQIATAQDISKKWGASMIPHVHLEMRVNGVLKDPTPFFLA